MKRFLRKLAAGLLACSMILTMMPAWSSVSAQEQPEQETVTIDFKRTAQQASEQTWWQDLAEVALENGALSRCVGAQVNKAMTSEQVKAYASMREWMAQTQNWTIVEEETGLNSYNGNRLYFCPDEDVNWGISYSTYFRNRQLSMQVEIPAEGWYRLELIASLIGSSSTDWPVDNTHGFTYHGLADIIVNGRTVYTDFTFKGNSEKAERNMGAVWLEEGTNSVCIKSTKSYDGSTNATPLCHLNLCSLVFGPLQAAVQVMETGSKSVDLSENWLAFDDALTNKDTVHVEDADILSAAVAENGELSLEGKQVGSTVVSIARSGEVICQIQVEVTPRSEESLQPVTIDFKAFAQKAQQQPWWQDLLQIETAEGYPTRRIGNIYNQTMTVQEKAAFDQMQTYLEENEAWKFAVSGWNSNSRYSGNRGYLCADKHIAWGLLFNAYFINQGQTSRLDLTVNVENAGWYSLAMDVILQGTGNKDYPADAGFGGGGATVDVLVNGQVVREEMSLKGSGPARRSMGMVYLNAGSNTISLESISNVFGTTVYTSNANMCLQKIELTPLGLHLYEQGSEARLDLRGTYLAYDADVSACAVAADENIADVRFDDNGDLLITAKQIGSTAVEITDETGLVCSFVIRVTESVEAWTNDGEVTVTEDGWYQASVSYEEDSEGGQAELWLDEMFLGAVDSFAQERSLREQALRPVYLEAGTYALDVRAQQELLWHRLSLRPCEEPELVLLGTALSMKKGRSANTQITAFWQDGMAEELLHAQWMVDVSDEAVLQAQIAPADAENMPVLTVTGLQPSENAWVLLTATVGRTQAQVEIPVTVLPAAVAVTMDAELKGVRENVVPRGSLQHFTYTMADVNGEAVYPSDVEITYTSEPEGIVQIDPQAHTLLALQNGQVTVTANVHSDGQTLTKAMEVTVADTGVNMLDDETAYLEGGTFGKWVGAKAPGTAGATAWQEIVDDGTGNHVLKMVVNPEAKYSSTNGAQGSLAYGQYVAAEPGHMYEFSFRLKIDEIKTPEQALGELKVYAQVYDYTKPSGGTIINEIYATRTYNTVTNGEWVEIKVPIRTPVEGDKTYYIMPTFFAQPTVPGDNAYSGWELTAWFDDFSLREVGFEGVDLYLEEPLNKVDAKTKLMIEPYTTTGSVIRMEADSVAELVEVSSTNPDVVDICGTVETATNAGSDNIAALPVCMVGLNAEASLKADVTIHGVTKTGTLDMTQTEMADILRDVTYTLDGFEAVTLPCGNTAEGDINARTTQLTPLAEQQLREIGSIYFKSSDISVAVVDQKTGDVTCVGEGAAEITVYVMIDGMVRQDTIPVVVTDDTDLAAISVFAPVDYVGVGNALQLQVSGTKSSGVKADMSLYPVAFCVDTEAASITQDGYLTALTPGTVTVTATAGVDGKAVIGSSVIRIVDNSELARESILMDFTDGKALLMETATLEKDGMELNRELTFSGGSTISYGVKGGLWVQSMTVGKRVVIDFMVARDGWYLPKLQSSLLNYGGKTDVYIDDAYVGAMDFNQGKSEWYSGKGTFNAVWLEAGVHSYIFECTKNGYIFPGKLMLDPTENPNEMDVSLSVKEKLLVGESAELAVIVDTASGTAYTLKNAQQPLSCSNYYVLESSDPAVVSVSGTVLMAHKAGEAVITANADVSGKSVQRQVTIRVMEGIISHVDLTAQETTLKPEEAGTTLDLILYKMDGTVLESLPETVQVSYASGNAAVAAVDQNGTVTITGAEGSAELTVTVTENGRVLTASQWITVTVGKTEPTIYTYAERDAAQENVLKYNWAWAEKESVVAKADYVVTHLDEFYELLIHEGFPRVATMGWYRDPDRYTCRYCRTDIAAKYGLYGWIVDPIENPWKITCPACMRDFPSNDFGAYYKSGLDETGRFREELADKSLLTNDLYPEMGEGWGVDAGFGYDTGNVYANGVKEVHVYIAYYLHCVFYPLGDSSHSLVQSLNALRDAYLYTGDEKYGSAGAILLDRVADLYPEYDYYQYEKQLQGKFIQATWEAISIAQTLATCADAFWPCTQNSDVIEYLRANAWRKGIDPEQITPDYLREQVDENILLEIKEACETCKNLGNFGMHQASMAYAAVALDRMPETKEMLDWVFRYGERLGTAEKPYSTGGSLLYTLLSRIDRDGFGAEGSAAYNQLWYQNLNDVADALANYDKVEGANLWKNPKFYNMFAAFAKLNRMGTTSVMTGETGYVQGYVLYPQIDYLIEAFVQTGDRETARVLYLANGNSVSGLHANIFTKDPESGLRSRVQQIINEDGNWKLSESEMMAGHGLAILRSGPETLIKGNNESKFSDYWMFFGINGSTHGVLEALHIGIGAYGLDLTSGVGYPNAVNTEDPERMQWMRNTVSHNTVVVDDWGQSEYVYAEDPLHFDDAGKVKVMDAEASNAYGQTEIYRRTMVTVQANEDVSYALDFFRVLGGSEHVYSFHANTMIHPETYGLDFVRQTMGTYAGADVPLGNHVVNPYTNDAANNIGSGYSWLDDVYRDNTPETTFSVDFKVEDFNNVLANSAGIHLKLTMLSREPMTEVAIASGHPSQKPENPEYLKYLLVRRSGSKGQDTLFTSVIEPYRYESYVASAQLLDVQLLSGTPTPHGKAAAVKVTLTDGREDYIVYTTDPGCLYSIKDTDGSEKFRFSGFVGVCSYRDGTLVYAYGNEATQVAEVVEAKALLTGTVTDFTHELEDNNYMVVQINEPFTAQDLENRYIYVSNDGEQNGVYRIYGAEVTGNTAVLDLHKQSPVRIYADGEDLSKGFVYNIAAGQTFSIPLSASFDPESLFNHTADQVVKTGNKLSLATGVADAGVTYEAEGLTTGMKFIASNGLLTWTPAKAQVGRYPITVKAMDTDGTVLGEMSFIIYAAAYTGSAYKPDVCAHSKAVTYEVDGILETVCPACSTITKAEAEAVQKFDIAGANMTLGNELKLNFLVKASDLGDGIYTAKITHNGEVTELVFTRYNSIYQAVTYAVSAKQMADVITVEVFDENGNAVSNVYETSVRTYAMNLLTNSTLSSRVKTLVVDMLNYGTEAQNYFGYNRADLANSKLTAAQKALATDAVSCTDKRVKGDNFYGSNLSLEYSILLNLYFRNCTADMYAKVIFTNYKGVVKTAQKSLTQYSGSVYKVVVDDIVLADAFSPVTVTVYNADGTVHGSATDSVESYIARTGNSAINEAIMKFAYSAKAYLG